MEIKIIKNIFYNLIGSYAIRRVLDNKGTGEGVAHFIEYNPIKCAVSSPYAQKGLVLYKEELNIHCYDNHSKIRSSRKYLYVLRDNAITKYFYDDHNNSILYQMRFNSTFPVEAEGTHKCNLDTYTARYIFYNSDSFDLHYSVLGPHKNYIIKTSYTRFR